MVEWRQRGGQPCARPRGGDNDAEIDQYNATPPEGWPPWCEQQISAKPGGEGALGNLGNCYDSLRDYRRAIDHYEQRVARERLDEFLHKHV